VTAALITSDGRSLAYRVVGDGGPTLVCHPGGPGFSSLYFGELAGLEEHLRLVLLQPRGTDGSDAPADPGAYQFADYVDDVEELRDHLGLERMNLFGHSHGGMVAQAYAARHPDRVERLILASTAARFAEEHEAAMQAGVEKRSGEPWYEDALAALAAEDAGEYSSPEELAELAWRELRFYFAHYGEAEEAYLDTLRVEVPNPDPLLLFNAEILRTFDYRSDLALVEAPTLVVTGEEDFITGPVCARELAAAVSGAVLEIFPDTGHFIFVEAPDRFRVSVLRFLGVAA
jgi:pimeloyl-ACP methyl ester carboxylesterase